MPASAFSLPVTGTITRSGGVTQVVLGGHLTGYDSFLSGALQIGEQHIWVLIITLDNVTVLRAVEGESLPIGLTSFTGTLHLSHGARPSIAPDDLAIAASRQGRTLNSLDDAEFRYALKFLAEATTTAIRQARIDAIVSALAPLAQPRV